MKNKFLRTFLIVCFVFFIPTFSFANSATSYVNEGRILQSNENWFGAIEQYQEALKINPTYSEVFFYIAECYYAVDEYNLSLSYIETAEKYLRNRTDLMNLRGFCYIGLGRLADATNTFNSILQTYPNDVDARFGLAELEILKGRLSGAQNEYKNALARQTTNKKALVSLALISDELNNTKAANEYINQALRYHSGNSEVFYFAAYLAYKNKNLTQAESYIRTAIQLQSDFDKAYELLANILYMNQRYEETIEICKYRISKNRDCVSAWYLQGLCLQELGLLEDAMNIWEIGLSILPTDELMRSSLELILIDITKIEDSRRSQWAKYHLQKAEDYSKKFYSVQARYEYKRALRLDPFNIQARLAYADLLLTDGYIESYLSQIDFIKKQGYSTTKIDDIVEGYATIMANTLDSKWDIDSLYLDKTRWNVGIFYSSNNFEFFHQDSVKTSAKFLSDMYESSTYVNADFYSESVKSYAEAFSVARQNGQDYFVILSFEENARENTLKSDIYSARTGNLLQSWNIYRTGNDKYISAMRRLCQNIENALPVFATIIERKNQDVIIDFGKKDGSELNREFVIIKKEDKKTADSTLALQYDDNQILGKVTITGIGEEISEGVISQQGFYDRINIGDLVIPIQKAEVPPENEQFSDSKTELPEIKNEFQSQSSSLLDLLRSIR